LWRALQISVSGLLPLISWALEKPTGNRVTNNK
jgi:hypothetical protein